MLASRSVSARTTEEASGRDLWLGTNIIMLGTLAGLLVILMGVGTLAIRSANGASRGSSGDGSDPPPQAHGLPHLTVTSAERASISMLTRFRASR